MDGENDTAMGDFHSVPSTSPSRVPFGPSTVSLNPHRGTDPILPPSIIPRLVSKSSSGFERTSLRDLPPPSGISSLNQSIKKSASDSNSAETSSSQTDSMAYDLSGDEMDMDPPSFLPTGLCYDVRMRFHCEISPTAEFHPEDPRRIYYIYKELCGAGLVEEHIPSQNNARKTLKRILARPATEDEISTVHTKEHFAFVSNTQAMSDKELEKLEADWDSIYFNRLSFESALLSAGGAIDTCLAVAKGQVQNAIAVIRPPGHHAETEKAMGFCVFNNVSVAASVCQRQLGTDCRKILILDWDVHHGNGIQKAFYEDPNVLYISIHVHQNGMFYPGGNAGNWDQCGAGPGAGKNVNIPWEDQGMGDGDYMYAFQKIVMPIALEFDPDLVIVAAGFDAAAGDVLGGCFVTPPCYSQMTHMLMSLAGGKLVVCLEGGYNFDSISKSALSVTKTLMGDPPERLTATTPSKSAMKTVSLVEQAQSAYWSCLTGIQIARKEKQGWTRIHDKIRAQQANELYTLFKLTPLFIYRNTISKTFEHQVLASSNLNSGVPIVVIFHDPPEIVVGADPISGKPEAHNTWIADFQKDYVEWIVKKGFAVIDVNIPKFVTRDEDTGKYEDEDTERPHTTEKLAAYLWDNYIDVQEETPEVFFIGMGTAFYGVTSFLINRDNLYKKVNSVISFVTSHPVRAVASATQTWMSKWYRENSLVFVSHEHGIWDHKLSKRYGLLRKSPQSYLDDMVGQHKQEVFDWISGRIDALKPDPEAEQSSSSSAGFKPSTTTDS
ncbi:hypothetical protein N7466_001046 [Penicillium verhagenii]|uniref:uncharacterized protein n=1 Tax=Penicillium verhagenii TaxID=1562060 RepID=UPI0025452E5D|nr:uncharacterized protein N7466_001046 [Penicillium verhagenii]KAJ5948031.1 hypothetical protein N7466_001046 [Penicillium verhagenii]